MAYFDDQKKGIDFVIDKAANQTIELAKMGIAVGHIEAEKVRIIVGRIN